MNLHLGFSHTWGRFHETRHNLRLIVALTMYHSLMVLAMDSVSNDGLSVVSQDTINRIALTMYHSLNVLAMDFVSYDWLFIASQDTINRNAS